MSHDDDDSAGRGAILPQRTRKKYYLRTSLDRPILIKYPLISQTRAVLYYNNDEKNLSGCEKKCDSSGAGAYVVYVGALARPALLRRSYRFIGRRRH